HHLPVLIPDDVPVDVDFDEVVIRAQLLELRVGGEQRAVVPEADIGQRLRVGPHELWGKRAFGIVIPLLQTGKTVGQAGHGDVVGDIGQLFLQLVGADDTLLNEARDEAGTQDAAGDQHGDD